MSNVLAKLEPQGLWKHFEELTRIPRCSKHEPAVAQYVIGVARRLKLEHRQDKAGNIVIRKPAAKGRSKAPGTVLQGHLDMVCEKNEGTKHNFAMDPIRIRRDGDRITADGTTLGADNGIGVAAALAVMESAAIAHGPLEFLFTVDEETGLTGAFDLAGDMLTGRRMLNMDSEEEGAVYIGCAGGLTSTASKKVSRVAPGEGKKAYRLKVTGLKGGHSGLEIHLPRGNAIKLLARLLWTFAAGYEMEVAVLQGGSKHNAIPREATAVFYLDPKRLPALKKDMKQMTQVLRSEMGSADPGVEILVESVPQSPGQVINPFDLRAVVNFLYCAPQGVLAMSPDIPGLVQSSTNVAVLDTRNDVVVVTMSHRSAVESSKRDIGNMVASYCEAHHFAMEQGSGYPGWQPNVKSPLLAEAKKVHQKLFGAEPAVKAIHAGLECGIIGEKFPGMDTISFGPTITGAHSPDEAVSITSVANFWKFLVGLLETA
ncbi:MAG: aminoacyl-histidine dipeptidase [Acidobacteria bacterium]|nr:aminoacyl-histidine dipeptidase [Acidobacteriota bacterium]